MESSILKLATLFDDELSNSNIRNVMVTKLNSGVYSLFNKYIIKPSNTKNSWYTVVILTTGVEHKFTTLKNAVTWCTLHNNGFAHQASKLHMLDSKLSSLQVELSIHSQLYRSSINESLKIIYATKIQEDIYKKQQVLVEIKKFVQSSILLQNNLFKNNGREFAGRR